MRYLLAFLVLSGCASTPNLIEQKHDTISIPEQFYNCPVTKIPNTEKLTDIEVASLISNLYRDNRTCKISVEGIKKFIEERNRIISSAK